MIDSEKLEKALKHLELQYANYRHAKDRPELMAIDREAIAESVIQRFETAYDTLWKDLKRHLIDALGLADVPSSPKPILKLAGENGLLTAPVATWLEYADARTRTAHDYSGEKAAETLVIVDSFIQDAISIYQMIAGKTWT
jgi:nucleotidyltransferase substrate binding protein (TIGR01987 family)